MLYDVALQWRHNGSDSVSNHQPRERLLNRLIRCRSSNLRVTGLCAGNSPGTGEFPAQMASCVENVSIWWRDHGISPWNSHSTQISRNIKWSKPEHGCYGRRSWVSNVYPILQQSIGNGEVFILDVSLRYTIFFLKQKTTTRTKTTYEFVVIDIRIHIKNTAILLARTAPNIKYKNHVNLYSDLCPRLCIFCWKAVWGFTVYWEILLLVKIRSYHFYFFTVADIWVGNTLEAVGTTRKHNQISVRCYTK